MIQKYVKKIINFLTIIRLYLLLDFLEHTPQSDILRALRNSKLEQTFEVRTSKTLCNRFFKEDSLYGHRTKIISISISKFFFKHNSRNVNH